MKILLLIIGFHTLLAFAEFKHLGTSGSQLDYIPIVNQKGERIIAINQVAVPENAIGYRIEEGEIEFVFKKDSPFQKTGFQKSGASSAENTESAKSHQRKATNSSSSLTGPALSHAQARPEASGEEADSRPPASRREAPSPQEVVQPPNDRQLAEQNTASKSQDLFPSGVNGNPGFPFKVLGPDFSEKCQATLISNREGLCLAATAAHCLYDGAKRALDKGIDNNAFKKAACDQQVQARGMFWGKGEVETADFGKVSATFFVNPEYHSGTKSEDSAVFAFPCQENPKVKIVSLGREPLQDGERVYYGKVMGGKEGLYEGVVAREPNVVAINSRPVGEAQESIRQPAGVHIQQGDSGGGVYRKKEGGDFELVGVLSTSDDITKKRPIGNYATNKSLDFIRCILNIYGRSKTV